MKTILTLFIPWLFVPVACGQPLSAENIFNLVPLSPSTSDKQLSQKGFVFTGKDMENDTLVRMYEYGRTKYFKDIDTISRSITRADLNNESFITYATSSFPEYQNLKAQVKKAGFFCNHINRGDSLYPLLYQNKDLSVRTSVGTRDSLPWYSLQFHKKKFPREKDIYYANDLLAFNSHEYLAYYFGEKNVKKDLYFLSGDKVAKCSVLFSNTNRQVVFIWGDEENRCSISSLLIGGQLKLQSVKETGSYVAENNWVLRSGLRPGMPLQQLRILNAGDFRFYGGRSANSGSIIPDNTGRLDFKKEEVVLGCLNCNDDKFTTAKEVNADDSLQDGRILFVLSVVLNPLLK